ncbi:MAG: bifunctional hydroxymethylpyrimidine kinase/phosphomethylpyrimidine kinase [Candidatus Aquicultorales bacterium]
MIGGSDPSGGAGIQIDALVASFFGAVPCAVVTAVTSQNSLGVGSFMPLPPIAVRNQIASVLADGPVAAVKVGMVPGDGCVEAILRAIDESVPLIVDPVLKASDGTPLFKGSLRKLAHLIERATLVTPNIEEAAVLTGIPTKDDVGISLAAEKLLDMGAEWALIKGGHGEGPVAVDVLKSDESEALLRGNRIAGKDVRGTGCMLASAVAALIANGKSMPEAAMTAKSFVTRAIERSRQIGDGSPQVVFRSRLF